MKFETINDDERIFSETAILHILRLSFEKELKWDFYYKGIRITAKISDPDFYISINNGKSFPKGDVLEANLQIVQKFDNSVNTWVNRSYRIDKIIRHTPRAEQPDLF